MPNAEPITAHVWMPDGRSLCDRRAAVPPFAGRTPTEKEYAAHRAEQDSAPSCGACLLLVSYIRSDAALLLDNHPGVWPASPSAAWASLEGTRWAQNFDPVAFSQTPGLDDDSRFDAVRFALHPEKVSRKQQDRDVRRRAERAVLARRWAHQGADAAQS
jgi:hypothetical protein